MVKKQPVADQMEEIVRSNLVLFRDQVGLNLTQAADLSGVPVVNLTRYEKGDSKLPATVLSQLAPIYGRDIADFMNPAPPPAQPDRRRVLLLKATPGLPLDADIYAEALAAIEQANDKQRDRNTGKKKK